MVRMDFFWESYFYDVIDLFFFVVEDIIRFKYFRKYTYIYEVESFSGVFGIVDSRSIIKIICKV